MKAGFNTFGARGWAVRIAAAALAFVATASAWATPAATEAHAPKPWQLNMAPGVTHSSKMAWEAHMVARCADARSGPESVLATLVRDAAVLRRWRPSDGSLDNAVRVLPREPVDAVPHHELLESLTHYRRALEAVPDDLKPEPDERGLENEYVRSVLPEWKGWNVPLAHFIAAKAFASWTAYQGRGVATVVRGLEAAIALVRVEAARLCRDHQRRLDGDLLLEAFRAADFILNHLAVGEDLATGWSIAEQGPAPT